MNDRLVDEEDEETVQDRKIRLAKRLIEKIQQRNTTLFQIFDLYLLD